MPQSQHKIKRNEKICRMRLAGHSYVNIAKKFGISKSRAWELFNIMMKKEEDYKKATKFQRCLSSRIQNCLRRGFGEDIFKRPKKLCNYPKKELFRIEGLGPVALLEIGIGLMKRGYIKDLGDWDVGRV